MWRLGGSECAAAGCKGRTQELKHTRRTGADRARQQLRNIRQCGACRPGPHQHIQARHDGLVGQRQLHGPRLRPQHQSSDVLSWFRRQCLQLNV